MGATRKKQCRTVILGVLLLSVMGVAAAENWQNWRGPRNNGTSLETGLPVQWSKTENVLWRLPLPGPRWCNTGRVGRSHLPDLC